MKFFVASLLKWYEDNARDLPWRSDTSPYRTWISEIMLQQTQVDTVLPYFERWMVRFPDIIKLADSTEQDVLSLWEGLGYYSRARNLYNTANKIKLDFNGYLPASSTALQKLPGIGPYTAAAIASIAFDEDIPAIDGNVRRVFSRLFDIQEPTRSKTSEKKIQELAQTHLPKGRAGDYNQALMDLGAVICKPKDPDCEHCPIKEFCLSFASGVQEDRPVRLPRRKVPHLTVTAAVIQKKSQVLLAQRPEKGLLGGLWEFPGGTLEDSDEDLEGCLKREIKEELGVDIQINFPFGEYKHAYTHFRITLYAFICSLIGDQYPEPLDCDDVVWVGIEQLEQYPMGKVDRMIASRLSAEGLYGRRAN